MANSCPYVDASGVRRRRVARSSSQDGDERVFDAPHRAVEDAVTRIARGVVAGLPLDTEVDLYAKLCIVLPIRVMGEILGVHDGRSRPCDGGPMPR